MTSAAPPTTVCGQVLGRGDAGAVVIDTSRAQEITGVSPGGDIYLRVARGCARGAEVRWVPTAAARKVVAARAADGRLAAIGIRPLQPRFTVDVLEPGRVEPIRVDVDLDLDQTMTQMWGRSAAGLSADRGEGGV